MKYHRQLSKAVMYDKVKVAKAVNAQIINLDDAPKGYDAFDKGKSVKYLIDPHKTVQKKLGVKAYAF